MIVWVASYPRSGNSLARETLEGAWGLFVHAYYPYEARTKGEIARVLGDEVAGDPFEYLESHSEPRFVKTHSLAHEHLDGPALYMVRDGRDALVADAHYVLTGAASARVSDQVSSDYSLADFERTLDALVRDTERFGGWAQHVSSWLAREAPTAIVRYEELRERPVEVLRKALAQLGIDLPESGFFPEKYSHSVDVEGKRYERGVTGNWREWMPAATHRAFWNRHRVQMDALSYSEARIEAPKEPRVSLPSNLEATIPTVVHISHWKAGTSWLSRILSKTAPGRVVNPASRPAVLTEEALEPAAVYPRCLITAEEYDALGKPPLRSHFVVIRDLRDTLVSAYFSLRYSHRIDRNESIAKTRARLARFNRQDGLLATLDEDMVVKSAAIQRSWLRRGESLIRYEDLVENDEQILTETLVRCGLPAPVERIQKIIRENRFENTADGRRRGEEDIDSHQRKAVPGDWRNHFDDELKDRFKERYGDLLIATGYERDLDW